jgi:hypothetical protein
MEKIKATEEQLVYANLLDRGMKIGLLILVVTFFLYMSGIMKPYIPVRELPNYWSMSVHDYLEHARVDAGWGWVKMMGKGDFLNFIGIAFLAGVSIVCYGRIIPIFLRKKDNVFAIIAMLEVLVLVLAASGLLKAGH